MKKSFWMILIICLLAAFTFIGFYVNRDYWFGKWKTLIVSQFATHQEQEYYSKQFESDLWMKKEQQKELFFATAKVSATEITLQDISEKIEYIKKAGFKVEIINTPINKSDYLFGGPGVIIGCSSIEQCFEALNDIKLYINMTNKEAYDHLDYYCRLVDKYQAWQRSLEPNPDLIKLR